MNESMIVLHASFLRNPFYGGKGRVLVSLVAAPEEAVNHNDVWMLLSNCVRRCCCEIVNSAGLPVSRSRQNVLA